MIELHQLRTEILFAEKMEVKTNTVFLMLPSLPSLSPSVSLFIGV